MVKAKKAIENKRHEGPQPSKQEGLHSMLSPDISAIGSRRDSFLYTEHDGRRLHSTAIEEDIMTTPVQGGMDGAEAGGMDGAEEGGGLDKGTRDKEEKRAGKKVADGCVTEEGEKAKRKRTMKRKHVRKSGVDSENQESGSADDENVGQKSPAKRVRNRTSSSGGGSGNRKSSSEGRNPRKQRKTMTKTTSASTDSESPSMDEQTKKGRRGATELEVVLEAFLAFCHQYRESVESKAVRNAIDSFSSIVEEELAKQITIAKELRVLMRDNAKMDNLIRKKRQRLLEAKEELMASEHQVESMQKEEARLTQRLSDITKIHTFLSGMSDLTKRYLDHRSTNPQEKVEYGASSLPALLLETKYVLGAENQLKRINDQLEARLQKTGN